MGPGDAASVEELVAGIDRGLYVCRLHYVNGLLEPRRAVMTGLTRDGCFLIERGRITRAVGNLRFTDSFLEGLARCDGATRGRKAIPTWWSEDGAIVTPAVRMRGFRFNGGRPEAPRYVSHAGTVDPPRSSRTPRQRASAREPKVANPSGAAHERHQEQPSPPAPSRSE